MFVPFLPLQKCAKKSLGLLWVLAIGACASKPVASENVPSLYAPTEMTVPVSAFISCLEQNGFEKQEMNPSHIRGRFIATLGKEQSDSHFWVRTLTFDIEDADARHQKTFSTCNEKAILETNKTLSHPDPRDPVKGIAEGTIQGGGTLFPLEMDGEWEFNGGRKTKFHAFYDTPPPSR